MWWRLLGIDFRRRYRLGKALAGPMRDYYAVPIPAATQALDEVRFVAVDLETTGLDAAHHEILSIGMVELSSDTVFLRTASHYLLAPASGIPESSAVIHRITDDVAAAGQAAADVIPRVLSRLAGKVLIAHHAGMERSFLDAACRRHYGAGLLLPVIDTEVLFRRMLQRRGQVHRDADLGLHALRERVGLPRYPAHDALTDALAAAELFIAFLAHAGIAPDQALKRVLTG